MADPGRRRRIVRRTLIFLALTPLLVWAGVTLGVKLTVAREVPIAQLAPIVGHGLFGSVLCVLGGCEADLPEGMVLETFDENLIEDTPVAFDVDEWGRVLVAESARQNQGAEDNRAHEYWLLDDLASRTVDDRRAYYRKWIEAGRFDDPEHFTRHADRLVALEDRDGDGVADTRSVLAEWNDPASGLVAGVEAREGEIWVTAIPGLHRVLDADRDGRAEQVETLHEGFGVKTSLIGHDLHGLAWGPDGRLYFSMGDRGYHVTLPDGRVLAPSMGPGRGAIFRMRPDGSELEVFATGVRNPQELAFDDFGNLFTGDNNGDGGDAARIVYLVEGGETGWAMPYQTLVGDYIRGPWVAERLWDLQHDTQPAWVLPPVAHLGNGPAGFVHYPGLGLPERYAGHFFLCDYGYTPGRSGIWSFALEPSGAGFEMVDDHRFAWSILATDVDFGWDGGMMATVYSDIAGGQSVVSMRHEASQADARLGRLTALAQTPMGQRETAELLELLDFPDQRIRLRAQYALADRGEREGLVELARDRGASLVPRLHAIWGLAQQGADGLRALAPEGFEWETATQGEAAELRAQLAKAAGEAGADWLVPSLRRALRDPSLRVRFFAAQSLGALSAAEAVPELIELLRENADRDVFVRHAGVFALHRIGDRDALARMAADESRSVRLASLLVWRQQGDARIAGFLADPDPLLVVEAARAIYDWPIPEAMPALAAMAERLPPVEEEDRQTGRALHRRVIGANVRSRSAEGATRLAIYAGDDRQLEGMRSLALEALGSYAEPPPRDLTTGFYRPLASVAPAVVADVFRVHGRMLVESSMGARAMEIATALGEIPLDDDELLDRILESGPEAERSAALAALRARVESDGGAAERRAIAREAMSVGLAAGTPALRNAARELAAVLDPDAAIEHYLSATRDGDVLEQQHAFTRLSASTDPRARRAIDEAFDAWQAGDRSDAVALELLQALSRGEDETRAALARSLLRPPSAGLSASERVAARRWARAGGNAEAGEAVFQGAGDCQRCHAASGRGAGGGHGGGAGPVLRGLSARGADFVLESLVAPEVSIAEGYGSVVVTRKDGSTVAGLLVSQDDDATTLDLGGGELAVIPSSEIGSRTEPVTGMPAMGLVLEPRALRDVIAYVLSLD